MNEIQQQYRQNDFRFEGVSKFLQYIPFQKPFQKPVCDQNHSRQTHQKFGKRNRHQIQRQRQQEKNAAGGDITVYFTLYQVFDFISIHFF